MQSLSGFPCICSDLWMAQLVTGVCLPKGKKEACGGARVPVCGRKDFLLQGRRGNGNGQLPRACASLIRSSSLQSGHSFPTWRVGSFFVHPGSCNLEHRKELMHGCLGDGQLLSSFFFPPFFRAASAAYGDSQPRGQIGSEL